MKICPECDAESGSSACSEHITVSLRREELAVLASAIRESLELIDEWEYDTRVGVDMTEAREMMRRLLEAYRKG